MKSPRSYKLAVVALTLAVSAAVIQPAVDAEELSDERNAISEIVSEEQIHRGSDGTLSQVVHLDNGTTATIRVNEEADRVNVATEEGEVFEVPLSQLREAANNNGSVQGERSARPLKKPNACQVATGAAGIAHSALWGTAVGGPAGAAAGAAVGAFWWAVGSQC